MSLTDKYRDMMILFDEIKNEVRDRDPNEYERWKAGGFLLDTNIVSHYPCLEDVVEGLGDEEHDEEDIDD